MRVVIDQKSGFCFGVVRAIAAAENALTAVADRPLPKVYSLGDIVHNRVEMQRLGRLGLEPISHDRLVDLKGQTVLIRAHGEPPATYDHASSHGIEIIDSTCPVVAKLQQRVRKAYEKMSVVGGQVVILGKRGHAEVVGLLGQIGGDALVVQDVADIEAVDPARPVCLLAQTTQSLDLFERVAALLRQRAAAGVTVEVHDTICREVSNREQHLREFARGFDIVVFVSGRKSSNGQVLLDICRSANPRTYLVEESSELQPEWFSGAGSVGVCGATSTPGWLMEEVAARVAQLGR